MKSTIVIYGSSTGTCQSIAETIAGKLGASAVDVSSIDEAAISEHDNLIWELPPGEQASCRTTGTMASTC